MRFSLDGLEVWFPYDRVYPEQLRYMRCVKAALDEGGPALLEMASGTGRRACLLAVLVAYQGTRGKRVAFCAPTFWARDSAARELKALVSQLPTKASFLAVCATSRAQACREADADGEGEATRAAQGRPPPRGGGDVEALSDEDSDAESVDELRARIARDRTRCGRSGGLPFSVDAVAARARRRADARKAKTAAKAAAAAKDAVVAPAPGVFDGSGVFRSSDLRRYCDERGWCAFATARSAMRRADVVICDSQEFLDSKSRLSDAFDEEDVVVFEDGHGVDGLCVDALSVALDGRTVDRARRCVSFLSRRAAELEASDPQRVAREYESIVSGEAVALCRGVLSSGAARCPACGRADGSEESPIGASPTGTTKTDVPGSLRRVAHFCRYVSVLLLYLKRRLDGETATTETPKAFLLHLTRSTGLETRPLSYFHERASSLLRLTDDVAVVPDLEALDRVATFATLASCRAGLDWFT